MPLCGRKEYVTEKSSDTPGNQFRELATSSAAPYPLRYSGPQEFVTVKKNIKFQQRRSLEKTGTDLFLRCDAHVVYKL